MRYAILFVILLAVSLCTFGAEAPKADKPEAPKAEASKERPMRPGTPDLYIPKQYAKVKLNKEQIETVSSTIVDNTLPKEKRINAIAVVATARVMEAAPALVTVIKRNDDVEVRAAAVWAARELKYPPAVPALLLFQSQAVGPRPQMPYGKKISLPTGDITLVELIEDSISVIGSSVLSEYLKVLDMPSMPYRQGADKTAIQRSALAVVFYAGTRDPRAIAMMKQVMQSPADMFPDDFRHTASLGLLRVLAQRTKEFERVNGQDKVGDAITENLVAYMLELEPSGIREYLASTIAECRPEYTVTLLTTYLTPGTAEAKRAHAVEVLGVMKSRETVEALAWVLENDAKAQIRRRAAMGLGNAGSTERGLAALTKALKEKDEDVRRAAIMSLSKAYPKQSSKLLLPMAEEKDAAARAAIVLALGSSGGDEAKKVALKATNDAEPAVRASAVAALGAMPSKESFEAIAKAVLDKDREVRYTAMRVLAQINLPASYAAIMRLALDPDRTIRGEAESALELAKKKTPAEFKAALIHVILNAEHPFSADACDIANYPGDKEVIDALRKACVDKRPAVKASALKQLKNIDGKR